MPGNIRNSTWLLRRITFLILALVLALVIGGITQTKSAGAAPRDQTPTYTNIRYHLKIVDPGRICVGRDTTIKVTPLADIQGSYAGEKFDRKDQIVTGVSVTAKIDEPKIATIKPPATQRSEMNPPKNLLEAYSLQYDNGRATGELVFKLHGNKAGLTNLYFESTLEKRLTGSTEKKISPGGPIQVENCDYTVNMNAFDIDSGSGVTIWTSGNLTAKITGDGGELTGTGNFAFDSGFVGPPCSISYSEFNNPTTITGQVDDNGQLTLQFAYQPGEITENASCPGGGGSFTHAIDLTNTGVTSATFPEEGGTRMIRFSYAGSDMAPGTMIIDVEPVPEQAGS